ncbi:hypothetical protein BC826DRAFT_602750 [Russula brevipes]|nr:hypothetical protein BC826DRAFT_602750 [Russula brevipes]
MRFGSILPITFLVLIVALPLLASVRAAPSGDPAVIIGNPQEGDIFLVGTQVVCLCGLGSFRDASQLLLNVSFAFVSDRLYRDLLMTTLELGEAKKHVFTIPEGATVRNDAYRHYWHYPM